MVITGTARVDHLGTLSSLSSHLTHWYISKLTIIGSDNGLSPQRRPAIIWTNAGILLIGPLGTNFSEILIKIYTFSFKKMHLKMSGKWQPFCLILNVLTHLKIWYWSISQTPLDFIDGYLVFKWFMVTWLNKWVPELVAAVMATRGPHSCSRLTSLSCCPFDCTLCSISSVDISSNSTFHSFSNVPSGADNKARLEG